MGSHTNCTSSEHDKSSTGKLQRQCCRNYIYTTVICTMMATCEHDAILSDRLYVRGCLLLDDDLTFAHSYNLARSREKPQQQVSSILGACCDTTGYPFCAALLAAHVSEHDSNFNPLGPRSGKAVPKRSARLVFTAYCRHS